MQDLSTKRRRLAENAVVYSTRLVDALLALQQLREERLQSGNFLDADFDGLTDGIDLRHLTPALAGTLFDFVVPDLLAAYVDAANGNRARNILLQMRR